MSDVFCDSSMMTNDNRRGGGTLKTELLLYMRCLIHQTRYLLIVITVCDVHWHAFILVELN